MADLVRARAGDPRPGLRAQGQVWTWAQCVDAALARAHWYLADRRERGATGPAHVGVLLENTPEFAFWLYAAALGRFTVVGLNPTRRGEELAGDVRATDCDLVLTDAAGRERLSDLDLGVARALDAAALTLPTQRTELPAAEPDDLFLLVFTSGTTGSPKAVRCSQRKITWSALGVAMRVELAPADVTYVSMPLSHSGAVIAGWGPTLAVGATLALRERFSASSFLSDVRAHGATFAHYVGTPLSYVLAQPAADDDADNPLQRLFGNEGAPADLERFGTRFGCRVLDGFGSSEGGISISRTPDTPTGSLGRGVGTVHVLDAATGERCPTAEFDRDGRLTNADQAVGELVGLDGPGLFEGYWNAPEDNAARLRDGHYWSGDLGYEDADGFLYFAGRGTDRLRVGGENFPAAPVARLLVRHPQVVEAVVYPVPDPVAGDQVMAAIVPADGFDPVGFAAWVAAQPDASSTWVPRYLRVAAELPRTPTGKVLVRELARRRWGPGVGEVWCRDGREATLRRFTDDDEHDLTGAFAVSGRVLVE